MPSQQARDNTGLQEECQSEDQGNAENEVNDFIAESESMLQSYCSRKNTNNQTFSRQVDRGQPPNEESLVSRILKLSSKATAVFNRSRAGIPMPLE